ncbi:uncharacterized protein LOC127847481 [Dreissena polymorpha]|uniref:Suppressor of cytokine signaling 7 n=1 Tax=Dreissena polymorpha TaxID=45954 RepID=A0A9D4DMU1_DREPO|nr:uncharacterized protein LOC127847481 [Dreissena polymorpha]KAH3752196.1 hypothetical protein DPMN_186808 [Dreissena polymorpha]
MEEVKAKVNKQFPKIGHPTVGVVNTNGDTSAAMKASVSADRDINSLVDPGYQSVKEVKPAKKYSLNQSIESLDEPGYESLDAVKKKIQETNTLKHHETEAIQEKAEDINDSALGMTPSVSRDAGSPSVTIDDCTEQPQHEDSPHLVNDMCVLGLTDVAVNLSNIAIAVQHSIGANHAPNSNPADVISRSTTEDLYSTVNKPVLVLAPETAENTDNHGVPDHLGGYDSDIDLILDPGYAECADAIKGCIQYGLYSDGSGSKISSCTSLDLSAEDFPSEPGYAECADAIKSGAIKKISVSQERLFDGEIVSEIYANPQILFRKRSQQLDEVNLPKDFSQTLKLTISSGGGHSPHAGQRAIEKKSSKSKTRKKGKDVKTLPAVAPPLPARNYSLALDGEEADAEVIDLPAKLDEEIDVFDTQGEAGGREDFPTKLGAAVDRVFDFQGVIDGKKTEAMLVAEKNDKILEEFVTCGSGIEKLPVDCFDSELGSKCAISEISETNCANEGSGTTVDESCDVEGERFHLTVMVTSGDKYTLTVVDRDESTHTMLRRKSNREMRSMDKEECSVVIQNNDKSSKSNSRALCNDGNNCGSSDSSDSDTTCENKSCSSAHCTKENSEHFDGRNVDCFKETLGYQEKTCSENSVTDFENVDDSKGEVILTVEHPSGEFSQGPENISYLNPDYLFTVNAIKLRSVSSIDSDGEFTEDLPKLEIRESDLDSPFDSDQSNTSVNLDIASESSVIAQLTNDLTAEFEDGRGCARDLHENVFEENICGTKLLDSLSSEPKLLASFDDSFESKLCTSNSYENPVYNTSSLSKDPSKNISAKLVITKDLSLPHGETTSEKHLPISSLRNKIVVLGDIDRSHTETNILTPGSVDSDDSAIEDNDEPDPIPQSLSDSQTIVTDAETKSSITSPSASQPLEYKLLDPMLYMDTEPTHMSLEEVMSPHPSPYPRDTSLSQGESYLDDFHQFVDEEITPRDVRPPRPPPVSGSHRNANSSMTPTEENFPGFRLCESAEEFPPPVPPRSSKRSSTRRPVSYSQDFMESMRQLKDVGWYWGPLSWEEAELKLASKPEGTFLVRDSSDERYILSLSFKNMGRVHHTRIEHHKGHFSFWSQPDSHGKSTIKEFIEQCVENSRNGRFLYFIRPSGPGSPPMPIHLLHPVSRFVQMRSLQHMCRFTIIQLVRRDHIDRLPVPTRIKEYLKQAQYYVEYLED